MTTFLAFIILQHRNRARLKDRFRQLAANSVEIEKSADETDAIARVAHAIATTGWPMPLILLFSDKEQQLTLSALTTNEARHTDALALHLNSQDIAAASLREGRIVIIGSDGVELATGKIYVCGAMKAAPGDRVVAVPVRLPRAGPNDRPGEDRSDELIGTLLILLKTHHQNLTGDDHLVLQGFASHLAIALSRIRSHTDLIDITNRVMASSRFFVAETLSGLAADKVS
jgi:hypothetical protein